MNQTQRRTIGDLLLQILGVFPIDRAIHRDAHAENLLDGPSEVFGHGSRARNLCGLNDVIEGDIAVVLDILHLLPITLRPEPPPMAPPTPWPEDCA